MTANYCCRLFISFSLLIFLFQSCKNGSGKKPLENFTYEAFKDSMSIENYDASSDTANLFDEEVFTPGIDSLDTLLIKIDTIWRLEAGLMDYPELYKKIKKTKEIYTSEEKEIIKENVSVLDSFYLKREDSLETANCKGADCFLYAEIIKSTQKLYLYIDGQLKDSFKVSTGIRQYETPQLNVRPSGPVFTKYTSKKFPGGNYEGLGNMPYAVFIKGGYAIHGTTQGNFEKLGTKASHGCIRLHPNNAKLFNELVKRVGLQNTWITVKDNFPEN